MLPKLIVRYEHQSHVLDPIYLSVGTPGTKRQWVAAFRDTIDGERVVWIRTTKKAVMGVWIKDTHGERRVPEQDIKKEV